MDRIERKLLVYLGKLEFNHIDDIVSRYCFEPLDDLVNAINLLVEKGYARTIEEDGITFYQRTVQGRSALTPGTPENDQEIPF
jgi:hypothetical protein